VKIEYRKKFLRELSRIPAEKRSRMERFVFKEIPEASSIFESGRVESMKGYPSYYKVRFGSYRIGLRTKNDKVTLERALHRKDIYRYFP
jgi:mRNA interferase RelE/StbE